MSGETSFEPAYENGELVALRLSAPDGREMLLRRGTADLATFEEHAKSVINAWMAPFLSPKDCTAINCLSSENVAVYSRIMNPQWHKIMEDIKTREGKEGKTS